MALFLLHVPHYLLLHSHTSVKPLLTRSTRKLTHSVTHYWTEAESTQWRTQETGWRARVELQNCTARNGAGECLVLERRAFPAAGSTATMTGVSQPTKCILPRTSHTSDLHTQTATQTPPSTLLLLENCSIYILLLHMVY